jgi:hypothetical protein
LHEPDSGGAQVESKEIRYASDETHITSDYSISFMES